MNFQSSFRVADLVRRMNPLTEQKIKRIGTNTLRGLACTPEAAEKRDASEYLIHVLTRMIYCPACPMPAEDQPDNEPDALANIIFHLRDHHEWSTMEIATVVDDVENTERQLEALRRSMSPREFKETVALMLNMLADVERKSS